MFTGIVQALVPVLTVEHGADLTRLTLALGALAEGLETGASVAVNGTCLTVTAAGAGEASFDIIPETTRTTNLGGLQKGTLVNVERSFKVGDEIGGHVVSGHVTGTAEVVNVHEEGHDHVVRFAFDNRCGPYLFHKGFVAVDGASLTISALNRGDSWFEVSLIPETLARTTLGSACPGTLVNIEVDAQSVATVETIERVMQDPEWQARLAKR